MSDAEWAVLEPLLPAPGWQRSQGGSPEVLPVPVGVAAISHAEWTVLLAGCCRCFFIGQARTMHSFEEGEYRRRDIRIGIAQVPSASAERANCTRK